MAYEEVGLQWSAKEPYTRPVKVKLLQTVDVGRAGNAVDSWIHVTKSEDWGRARSVQGRSQDVTLGHRSWVSKARETRRRGIRIGIGQWCPLPNRLGGLGERREAPQRGRSPSGVRGSGTPAANAFLAYLRPREHFWWREQCYFSQFSVKKITQSTIGAYLFGGKRGDYQNCSVLYCVLKLCTVISTLRWAVLTVRWIRFCLTGPISLCVDLFVFVCIYVVFVCIYVFCFVLHSCPSVLWHCWLGHLTRRNPSPIWPIMCLVGR